MGRAGIGDQEYVLLLLLRDRCCHSNNANKWPVVQRSKCRVVGNPVFAQSVEKIRRRITT